MSQFGDRAVVGPGPRLVVSPVRAFAALMLLASISAAGQVLPLGPEFQVNTWTTGSQNAPIVRAQPEGTFVVVWAGPSSGSSAIVTRRFGAGGLPLTGEVEVVGMPTTDPTGLAVDANGDLVVIWGFGTPGPHGGFPHDVEARGLDGDLTPAGPSFVVSEFGQDYYGVGPGAVASPAAGEFVVAWREYGIQVRRHATDGTPLTPQSEIASVGYSPSVAALPGGAFVVSWREMAPEHRHRARIFDTIGTPVGEPITIAEGSEVSTGNIGGVDLAAHPSGGFIAVWSVWQNEMRQIRARRFASDGASLGPSFRVDPHFAGYSRFGGVAVRGDGSFVISWTHSAGPVGTCESCELHARWYASDETPLGAPFYLNEITAGTQWDATLAFLPSGDLVAAWTSTVSSGNDTSGTSILARRFRLPFFMDGFESGDTSRWSSAP
ncbi:MAG: hypothetical protein AMXMBFR36_35490 [Acidobacteriota bacterium]